MINEKEIKKQNEKKNSFENQYFFILKNRGIAFK